MGILTRALTLNPASGYSFVTIASGPATGTNTVKGQYGALAVGDQVEWVNTSGISISSDGTISRNGTGDTSFNARIWATATQTWSTTQSLAFSGLTLTGQALSLSMGQLTALAGATVVALPGQAITPSQGELAYKLDMRFGVSGQVVTAAQGAIVVGVGEAVLIELPGQQLTFGQSRPSLKYGTSQLVALNGQAMGISEGTLAHYISIVKVALNGQPLTLEQAEIVKIVQGLIPTNWTPEGSETTTWTPTAAASLSWTPESGSVTTWKNEGR